MRNWLTAFWPASFKGVPFWVEQDGEEGGRRLVVHEFPNRDDPFVEDMGEAARYFDVTAYLASDRSDSEAVALTAACAAAGAGILVLPSHGPLQVNCLTFRRDRDKDTAGKIAYALRFVREGAAVGIVSVAYLANLVFAVGDRLQQVAGAILPQRLAVRGQPDHVVSAAVEAVRNTAAQLEAVRSGRAVDPEVSARAKVAIQALYDAAPVLIARTTGVDPSVGETITAIARDLSGGMAADSAIAGFAEIVADSTDSEPPQAYVSTGQRLRDSNIAAVRAVTRLAALTAWCDAVVRNTYHSRPEGITARADIAERIGFELDRATGAENAELYVGLQDLQGKVVEYLTRLIADLAPIIKIEASRSMPSLWWAWRLHADPSRAGELVARNQVQHPSFMPLNLEALAK